MNTPGYGPPHIQFGMQMTRGQNLASNRDRDHGSILVLGVLALIVGAVSGFVGALFLLLLERADRFRDALIGPAYSITSSAHASPEGGM